MPLFRYNVRSGSKDNEKPRRDIFSRHGGKVTKKLFDQHINKLPLHVWQREYVKQVMEKHNTIYSRGITRQEFHQGLDEMAKNTRDPIRERKIKRLKKHF